MIGFDSDQRLFYEGASLYGHAVWPSPMLTPAAFVAPGESNVDLPDLNDIARAKFVFREDSFDPITRIRRGRFYTTTGIQPQTWQVQCHPAVPSDARKISQGGTLVKSLYSFQRVVARAHLTEGGEKTVVLGSRDLHTRWTAVAIEMLVTAEELVTLKAQASLGAFPRLNSHAVPTVVRDKVSQTLDTARDALYRMGPESVIDRCRDAAQVALAGKFAVGNEVPRDDLGKLAERMEKEQGSSGLVVNSARIIARLHARGKPNEQRAHQTRAICEQDADLAVSCLGFLLCDLGWAEW